VALPKFLLRPHGVGAPLNVYMFTPRSLARHVKTLLFERKYFAARLRVMAYQIRHPGAPWLTASAVHVLDRYLNKSMVGLEWGSGKSTIWFARRLRMLVSVEHDASWHARISRDLKRLGLSNVDYRLASAQSTANPYVGIVTEFPDEHFDFVLVDGERRSECLEAAIPKLKPGGLLVLDNADQNHFVAALRGLEHRSTHNGVWRTDLFFKPQTDGERAAQAGTNSQGHSLAAL
jgi:predicted O-methyltransferase YrrM